MGIFGGQDDDSDYENDQSDRGMFSRESRDSWQRRRDRAREISSGLVSGMFEKDEAVWAEVKKLEDKEE